MAVNPGIQRGYLVAFFLLAMTVIALLLVRVVSDSDVPAVEIVNPVGGGRTITLSQLKRMPSLTRKGTYQNQFYNWRDPGVYTGVLLTDLPDFDMDYDAILVLASDGYEIEIERERVENPDYPMTLAYAYNGLEVPDWEMGFRIVVLPEDGDVGNEEYGVSSAGQFWVKNVVTIRLEPRG